MSSIQTTNDPKVQVDVHFATVSDQIAEDEVLVAKLEDEVLRMRDAIRSHQRDIKSANRRIAKNKERRVVFLQARFDLERIDAQ